MGFPEENIINGYIRAFNFRPFRIEPLYRLASYYRSQGKMEQGYQVARYALSLPPSHDEIPAIKWSRDWMRAYGLWFECMLCSYDLFLHNETLNAALKLLNAPSLPIRRLANVFASLETYRRTVCVEGILYNYNGSRN